jgi:hypothetical protein
MLLPVEWYASCLTSVQRLSSPEYSSSIVAKLAAPPLRYQFTTHASSANATDLIFCHFFFANYVMRNTVTCQFISKAGTKGVMFTATATTTSRPAKYQQTSTSTSSLASAAILPSATPP